MPIILLLYQDKIVANFGNGLGLREYDGSSWKLIEALVPDKDGKIVNYKDGLIVDFGAPKKESGTGTEKTGQESAMRI